jgi:hypothetical protein
VSAATPYAKKPRNRLSRRVRHVVRDAHAQCVDEVSPVCAPQINPGDATFRDHPYCPIEIEGDTEGTCEVVACPQGEQAKRHGMIGECLHRRGERSVAAPNDKGLCALRDSLLDAGKERGGIVYRDCLVERDTGVTQQVDGLIEILRAAPRAC